jgi:peroxiredoxin
MGELFKGKKGILFALPGAFTPGCSAVSDFVRNTGITSNYYFFK